MTRQKLREGRRGSKGDRVRQMSRKGREYELEQQSLLVGSTYSEFRKKTRPNKEFKLVEGQTKEEVRNWNIPGKSRGLDAAIRFECKKGQCERQRGLGTFA